MIMTNFNKYTTKRNTLLYLYEKYNKGRLCCYKLSYRKPLVHIFLTAIIVIQFNYLNDILNYTKLL